MYGQKQNQIKGQGIVQSQETEYIPEQVGETPKESGLGPGGMKRNEKNKKNAQKREKEDGQVSDQMHGRN
jgi:hypothetical protein